MTRQRQREYDIRRDDGIDGEGMFDELRDWLQQEMADAIGGESFPHDEGCILACHLTGRLAR